MGCVRRACPEEHLAVSALIERAYAKWAALIGQRPAPMDDDYKALIASGHVFAIDDGEIAGIIVLEQASDYLLIENVAVAPAKQGKGFGRALLEFAEEHAHAAGITELRLYTNRTMTENIDLYSRTGWRQTPKWADAADTPFERVYFVKNLPKRSPLRRSART